jgi:hypothetical protein
MRAIVIRVLPAAMVFSAWVRCSAICLPCSEALADDPGSGPGAPSLNGSFVGATTVRSSSEQPGPAMTEPTSAA